jgi:hypothetical protein
MDNVYSTLRRTVNLLVKLKNQKVEKYVHERLLLAEGGF